MWFGRKKRQEKEEADRAYQLGQEAGSEIATMILEYTDPRFAALKASYLGVLRDRLQRALVGVEAPAVVSARVEYTIFSDNVEELRSHLNNEVQSALSDALRFCDEIGIGSDARDSIHHHVGAFCSDLRLEGLKLLTDYAVPLKDADVRFRKLNPEISAKFPEVE